MIKNPTLAVIGTGYVGLVTGCSFANKGYLVHCIDIDQQKIDTLNQGKCPIYEPDLSSLIEEGQKNQRLFFSTDYEDACKADICFLALPTPCLSDGSCDTRYLFQAFSSLVTKIKKPLLIVNKSTAPVGTCSTLQKLAKKLRPDLSLCIASNPEFLREGSAVQDSFFPDRIVIGVDQKEQAEQMKQLYAPFCEKNPPFLVMSTRSAELAKYAANCMLASRISFMNEMATLCEAMGAHIQDLKAVLGTDPRIGPYFLEAGIGFGGSCFPKDIEALQKQAKHLQIATPMLEAIETINEKQKKSLVEKMESYFKKEGLQGKTIAIWGVSFKPNTDDIRKAPSIECIELLRKKGAILQIYDPAAMNKAKKELASSENLVWCSSVEETANNADAIALLTEWKEFAKANFSSLKKVMKGQAVFDGRNQLYNKNLTEKGFDYVGVGVD